MTDRSETGAGGVSRRVVLRTLALGGAVVLLAAAGVSAKKPAPIPVSGNYSGTAVSSKENGEFQLELTVSNPAQRKLTGTFNLSQNGTSVAGADLKGTISASGRVSLRGRIAVDGKPANVLFKGQFTDVEGVRTIEGVYKVTRGGDAGTFSVTQL